MKKLIKYSEKSNLMNIRIKMGPEIFRFNLFEELKVNENFINDEIASQPTIQGFLGTLFVKLDRIKSDKEAEVEKVYAELFVKYKGEVDKEIGRFPSDDMAKQKVLKSERYQKALAAHIEAKENAQLIKNCLETFEQRAFLIQTLSANIRKSS
jgi:hypothetical protein